jgi:hypothetical protein
LEALVDFPGKIGKFPGKYLGLHSTHASYDKWTSSLCSTKSEDDFRAGKGKLLSMAGRETLVKMCANFTPSLSSNSLPDAKMVVKTDRQNVSKLPLERRRTGKF